MLSHLIELFNLRSGGEQALILILAGVAFLVLGIATGRVLFFLFGG